jgi:serine/threonine-protein kinase HipA
MNNERVGTWSRTAADVDVFAYDLAWTNAERGRPLSLTLPFLPGNGEHRGAHVANWFENLLPDSSEIRSRIARRFGVRSSARSLLAEIGRDCVGAVQILPDDVTPMATNALSIEPLTTADVARVLRGVTSSTAMGLVNARDDNFRISVAGAQEKTALLRRDGQWYRPHGTTPTTHILKLPLGLVGNMRYDLEHSIANEWLCLRLLDALGFDVAHTEMATFEDHVSTERALVVERFDRQWIDGQRGLIRLPQEDLCQATGTGPTAKYEHEGGPGMRTIVTLMKSGAAPEDDVRTFVLAQLAFWLLAAIDGHAKNFSIFLRRDGYLLTPLYDVLSAWPIIGAGPNHLPRQQAKLAMAVRCKNAHYEIDRILTRHWQCVATQSGVPFSEMVRLAERVPGAINQVSTMLPDDFPEHVWDAVTTGMRTNLDRFSRGSGAH